MCIILYTKSNTMVWWVARAFGLVHCDYSVPTVWAPANHLIVSQATLREGCSLFTLIGFHFILGILLHSTVFLLLMHQDGWYSSFKEGNFWILTWKLENVGTCEISKCSGHSRTHDQSAAFYNTSSVLCLIQEIKTLFTQNMDREYFRNLANSIPR